ncbi:hypothetical protein [Macrococcus equipercicus]|nr:hypothetical protein [Macrococcus equipercicus]
MDKAVSNYLEYELRCYKAMKQRQALEDRRQLDRFTAQDMTALERYRRSRYRKHVIEVIEETYESVDELDRQLIELYYFDNSSVINGDGVADKLHISRRDFYNRKQKILDRLGKCLGVES